MRGDPQAAAVTPGNLSITGCPRTSAPRAGCGRPCTCPAPRPSRPPAHMLCGCPTQSRSANLKLLCMCQTTTGEHACSCHEIRCVKASNVRTGGRFRETHRYGICVIQKQPAARRGCISSRLHLVSQIVREHVSSSAERVCNQNMRHLSSRMGPDTSVAAAQSQLPLVSRAPRLACRQLTKRTSTKAT